MGSIARLHKDRSFGMTNSGWRYDAYPELETLDADKSITIAAIEGPAIITQIHSTQHLMNIDAQWMSQDELLVPRSVILEIYFDEICAVRVPLADFFADGCNGRAGNFGMTNWLFAVFDRYIAGEVVDLNAELADAEQATRAYLDCLADLPPFNPAETNPLSFFAQIQLCQASATA
jgi:hypothetical protein